MPNTAHARRVYSEHGIGLSASISAESVQNKQPLVAHCLLAMIAVLLTGVRFSLADEKTAEVKPPEQGLVLWLDASTVEAEDGAKVSSWRDRSSKANDVSQDSAKHQPVLAKKGLGGQPALQFRSGQMLDRADFAGFAANDQAFHIAIVFQAPAGGPPSQRLIDFQSQQPGVANANNQHGFWVGFQGSRYLARLGIANGDEGEGRTAVWDAKPHLLELIYKGNQQFEIHVDGRTDQAATYGGRKFLGFRNKVALAIGQHFAHDDHGPTFLHGDIAELFVYQRPLSKIERFELGSRLTKKYSLKTQFRRLPIFERDIRPILAANCLGCHGEKKKEAGLDLRTVSSMMTGGEAGPVIVRGHPEFSELVAVLEAGSMPPDEDRQLTTQQIELIRSWVDAEAPAKESIVIQPPPRKVTAKDREHYAWQMPVKHAPPEVRAVERVRNEIDRFVLARLEGQGLAYSREASPRRLVRRLYFDLVGLPPSPEDVERFLKAEPENRVQTLVDELLSSRHFGERWGRHWLDVAGYVDVYGSDNDAAIIKLLSGKWKYRDYVIRSFNDDKPFDQFLVEQLAGDQLDDWRQAEKFSPEMRDRLTATAFLLSANDDTDAPELNTPDVRHHVLQRTGENVANSLLAVTLQCSRCHDHKYEAVSQIDYYRFESIFAGIFNVRDWAVSTAHVRPEVSDAEKSLIDQHNAMIDGQVKPLQQRLDQLKKAESEKEKVEAAELAKKIAALTAQKKSHETIPLATSRPSAPATHVLRRGDYLRPGLEVQPGLLELFTPATSDSTAVASLGPATSAASKPDLPQNRRLTLARALTDPNSLAGNHVARVFVNRVWQQLFGAGIVETSDNLGVSGSRPSHPKLLDWLTRQFIEDGWRVKPLIRRMVLSAGYQQSSVLSEEEHAKARKLDPANRLLWRMNLRRLDSEQLRDAILTVSGQLDRSFGGPPIPLDPRPDGMVVIKKGALPPGTTANRRSVYILHRRNYHMTFMRVFDQPIVARNCSGRKASAVVNQSLALLHDDFLFEQSAAVAERIEKRHADGNEIIGNEAVSAESLVEAAWQIVVGRSPDEEELSLCRGLLDRHEKRFVEKAGISAAKRMALTRLCHMLLNSNEFLYVP
jgi:hypothetical protein